MKHKNLSLNKKQKYLLWTGAGALSLLLIVLLSFRLSPWPGALLIREVFNQNSHKTLTNLEESLPPKAVTTIADQAYDQDGKTELDVYIPDEAIQQNKILPTVIWTHGGAWLSGDKTNAAPYFQTLASKGFTVVSVNYTLAPNATYPKPIHELNQAHQYLLDNAERFHIDPDSLFFAGDSAGSQLSSQLAALITNPSYAKELGVTPALSAKQVRGMVLFCGIYKMDGLVHPDTTLPKIVSWGDDVAVWAYTGTRNKSDPSIHQMSAYYHVNADYPATFISGGNDDPLTAAQSIPFANKLESMGVKVTSLFFEADHRPKLPHEYQFTMNEDGQKAFDEMVDFLSRNSQ